MCALASFSINKHVSGTAKDSSLLRLHALCTVHVIQGKLKLQLKVTPKAGYFISASQ